ncbi:UvrD-helicase domain-containing protein [Bacillus alkalicellulosilyticus]|uniref:UvrD-helicase domain-containing protein n=1 Tax=Alkalihalobacterium alkalicellulosilyticum TaxID=1912214 RepID=UPI000996A293|nr:UvrD-helicase domain-containing protein [Bacillus alkalicellulosilyticus]
MSNIIDQQARDDIKYELDRNFLVEAGAGSGKTTSLVSRMIQLVYTGKAKTSEIVAITFTRKAADELKVRFQSQLEKSWKNESDEMIKERLFIALQTIDQCFLGTVHAFCAKLLRERPIESGLDIHFKELEESDDIDLLEEVWQRYLKELEETNPQLLQQFSNLGIAIQDLFSSLRQLKEYPDVQWVTEEVEKPDLLVHYGAFMRIVKEAYRSIPTPEPDRGYDTLQKAIIVAIQKDRYIDENKDSNLLSVFEVFDKKLKATQNRWTSKEDAKYYEEKIQTFFDNTIQPVLFQWRCYCHPIITSLLQDALSHYENIMKQRSLLNFQDLLLKVAHLLQHNHEVRSYFQSKYRFLLLDEFQDTDPIQAEIVFYLANEDPTEKDWTRCTPRPGTLFVVGDPKQAIYRFRRADIDTYNLVKQLIERHGGEVLHLTMNFRTLDSVTKGLNEVFSIHLPEQETSYQAGYRPLHSFHQDKGEAFSGIKQLVVPSEYSKKDDVVQKDAENIASTIENLLTQGFEPKDFMVMTRYNDGIEVYSQMIEKLGIPVSISGEIIIGNMKEFKELMILLQTFVDPTNEVNLLATLRGTFFGISDQELYHFKRNGGYYNYYTDIPLSVDTTIREKFKMSFQRLSTYQKWIRTYLPTVAIEKIMEDSGFFLLLLLNQHGKRAYKSVLQLLESLRKQESNGLTSYQSIFRHFQGQVEEKTVVANLEEDANAVRIMNAHKTKGLEAPVVFLAHPIKKVSPETFLSKHIKRIDDTSLGYFSYSVRMGFHQKTIGTPPEWEQVSQEELRYLYEEELRILYVAATRAEKALIISASKKNNSKNPWSTLFEAPDIEVIEVSSEQQSDLSNQNEVVLTLEDYQATSANSTIWLEHSKTMTYDHWSPTKDKDYTEVVHLERESGGGKEWGSLIHDILEKLVQGVEISAYVSRAMKRYNIPGEREQEVWEYIQQFQNSHLWNEIAQADDVQTEIPFYLKVTHESPLYPLLQSKGAYPIYVKGVIDLAYKKDNQWNIVDYKTDRLKNKEDLEALQSFYKGQILFYKQAWEYMTKETVSETFLYFFQNEHLKLS